MESYRALALLLIAVAVGSIALQYRHYRRGVISARRAITASIARFGFVVLGITYATGLAERSTRTPLIGLAIVGAGIFLHLGNNILENLTRRDG